MSQSIIPRRPAWRAGFLKICFAVVFLAHSGRLIGANAFCVGGPLQANFAYAQWGDALACAQSITGRNLVDAALLHLGHCTSNMVNATHPVTCDMANPVFYGPWESRKHIADLIFNSTPPANPRPVYVDEVAPNDGYGGTKSLGQNNDGVTVVNVNGIATMQGPYAHLMKLLKWDGSDNFGSALFIAPPSGDSHSNLTNLTLYVQHQGGVPNVNGRMDAPFHSEGQRMLVNDSVTRVAQVIQKLPMEFANCVNSSATSEFGNNNGITDGFSLVNKIRETLFNYGFLLIGGFSFPPNPDFSIVTGFTWHGFGRVNYSPNSSTPVAPRSIHRLNLNTHPFFFRRENLPGIAGTVMHELLHTYGFDHNGNGMDAYADRGKFILAAEDCVSRLSYSIH